MAIKCTQRSQGDGEGEGERGKAIQREFKSIQPQKTTGIYSPCVDSSENNTQFLWTDSLSERQTKLLEFMKT